MWLRGCVVHTRMKTCVFLSALGLMKQVLGSDCSQNLQGSRTTKQAECGLSSTLQAPSGNICQI